MKLKVKEEYSVEDEPKIDDHHQEDEEIYSEEEYDDDDHDVELVDAIGENFSFVYMCVCVCGVFTSLITAI